MTNPFLSLAVLDTNLDFSGAKNPNPYCAQIRSQGSRRRICPLPVPSPVAGEGPTGQIAAYSGLRLGSVTFCASLLGKSQSLPPCGARKNLRAARLLDFFDRYGCSASLHPPLAALGSAPPTPFPDAGKGDSIRSPYIKNAPSVPYKRRRVGRNLRLSRTDPTLCFGQPSPLRCILLSPQGLTTLRGPQFYGVYRRVGGLGALPE